MLYRFITCAAYALLIVGAFGFVGMAKASSTGTIVSAPALAWSNQIGWINFNPTNGFVAVENGRLTGYVWSQNYGWINLAPSGGGVLNDGQGVLSGSAWGEQVGWIDFNGVTIDEQGVFHGTAAGPIIGTLAFSCTACNVKTSWLAPAIVGPNTAGPAQSSWALQIQGEINAAQKEMKLRLEAPGATAMRLGTTLDVLFAPWQPFLSVTTFPVTPAALQSGVVTIYGQAQDSFGAITPITPFLFSLPLEHEVVVLKEEKSPRTDAPTPHSLVEQGVVAGLAIGLSVECYPFLTTTLPSAAPRSAVEVRKLQYFLQSFLRRGTSTVKSTGKYDAATKKGVQTFQKLFPADLGRQAPGNVGELTRRKINDLACQAKLYDIFSTPSAP